MSVADGAVATIRSRRLDLVRLSPDVMSALVEGRREEAERLGEFRLPPAWPDEHDRRFLAFRLKQIARDAEMREWLVRAVVARDSGRPLVGHAGFHGKPGVNARRDADAVEIGYTIFEPYRGQGYATEAVRALIEWASGERGIRRFVASVAPDNAPSLAIVRKLGFVEVGRHWDAEDGEELEFALTLASAPAP
jgi:ribosomal-protein-alanine N-acetyltransferase